MHAIQKHHSGKILQTKNQDQRKISCKDIIMIIFINIKYQQ
jgi:hypothetical protein